MEVSNIKKEKEIINSQKNDSQDTIALANAKKPIVLEEDKYIEGLSTVIKRDYFPNIDKIKMQNELLDAIQEQNSIKVRDLSKKILNIENNKNNKIEKNDNVIDTSLSVDSYQMKYTSEDNDSFNELLSKVNEEKKVRNEKIYGPEKTQLLLTDGSVNENSAEKGSSAETKQIETWKYKPKNALMYVPDGNYHIKETEEILRQAPKQINHSNTRFEDTTKLDIKNQERLKTQEVWKNMITATPALFQKESLEMKNLEKNEYGFVASTPSPNPNKIDASDLFTWGSIEGTPLLMDSGATPGGPVFKIPDTPKRELIGMRLSEKAGSELRKRQGKTSNKSSTTPRSLPHPYKNAFSPMISRATSLSPAAKNLLKKSMNSVDLPSSLKSFGSDSKLKSSYNSPLLYQQSSSYKRPTSGLSTGILRRKSTNIIRESSTTPQIKSKTITKTSSIKKDIPEKSLTDNLLNFNK